MEVHQVQESGLLLGRRVGWESALDSCPEGIHCEILNLEVLLSLLRTSVRPACLGQKLTIKQQRKHSGKFINGSNSRCVDSSVNWSHFFVTASQTGWATVCCKEWRSGFVRAGPVWTAGPSASWRRSLNPRRPEQTCGAQRGHVWFWWTWYGLQQGSSVYLQRPREQTLTLLTGHLLDSQKTWSPTHH